MAQEEKKLLEQKRREKFEEEMRIRKKVFEDKRR